MSWLSDAVSGRKSAEKSSRRRRQREAAAKKAAAAQKAARERAARAAAAQKAAADAARAQQQAQARAKQAAKQRAAEQAERQRVAAEQARIAEQKRLAQEAAAKAKAESDARVSAFNKNLAAAKQAGTKEMQLLRVEGLKSEDARVRELAGGITENKATSLDAPSRQVSQQKASVKQKIKRRSSSSGGRGTTLGSLGGGQPGSPFSLG